MRTPVDILTLGASSPGQASWSEFVASFRRTAEDQLDMLPALGFFLLLIAVIAMNWKLAKRLSKSLGGARPAAKPKHTSADAKDPGKRPRRAA